MMFLYHSQTRTAGRGTETACILLKNVVLDSPPEMEGAKIFLVGMWRPKTLTRQEISVFPQKQHMLRDFYFLFGYYLIMSDTSSKFLFPAMSKKAGAEIGSDDKPRAKSKVSKVFKTCLDNLRQLAQGFSAADDGVDSDLIKCTQNINPKVTSHSQKRLFVNYASQNDSISTIWVCFRAGWMFKSMHSIFDYLNPLAKNVRKVGRVTADWSATDYNGSICGGYPPRVNIDEIDQKKMNTFVLTLFMKWESFISEEMMGLLAGSIFRHLPNFVHMMAAHPEKKFGSDDETFDNHRFLLRLKFAASNVGWTPTDLINIHSIVYKDFVVRNMHHLPFHELVKVFPDEAFQVDCRNLQNYMKAQCAATINQNIIMNGYSKDNYKLTKELGEVKAQNVVMQTQNRELREDMRELKKEFHEIKGLLTLSLQNQATTMHSGNHDSSTRSVSILPLQVGVAANANSASTIQSPVLPMQPNLLANGPYTTPTQSPLAAGALVEGAIEVELPADRIQSKCVAIFEHWYLADYSQRYVTWKSAGHNANVQVKNTYSERKGIVEIMNCFLKEHIKSPPDGVNVTDVSQAAKVWRTYVRDETNKVFQGIRTFCDNSIKYRKKL